MKRGRLILTPSPSQKERKKKKRGKGIDSRSSGVGEKKMKSGEEGNKRKKRRGGWGYTCLPPRGGEGEGGVFSPSPKKGSPPEGNVTE